MVVLFIGISGSGKDTQAHLLAERKGFVQIASGQLLRERAGNSDELGKRINEAMQKGFVESDLIMQMLDQEIEKLAGKDIVLNGTVRKLEQVEMVDKLLAKHNLRLDLAIYFELSESEAVHRLYLRRHCAQNPAHIYHLDFFPPREQGKCDVDGSPLLSRRDDQPAAIHERLVAFKHDNLRIYERYQARGILRVIDAGKKVEDVYNQLEQSLL